MCAATAWICSSDWEKDGKIGQDDHHTKGDELQKLTDANIKDIDAALHAKEQEIMQV